MDIQPVAGLAVGASPTRESRDGPALPEIAIEQQPQQQKTPPTKEEVREAVKEIQASVDSNATNLQFSVDEATGKTVVSVIDSETRQVVRQIPSEEVMRMARAVDRMQGLLFNGKA